MKKRTKLALLVTSTILAATIPFGAVSAENNETLDSRNSSAIQMLHRQYPNGSYYSTTGSACTCHSWCEPYSNCTCIKFDNASQCDGFARYCYYCYNDEHVDYYDSDYSGSTVTLNTDNLYSYLQAIGNCAYIRGYTLSGSIHSVFVVSYSDEDVTVYQANYGARCLVKYETVSYSNFLRYMQKISWCVTNDGTFMGGPDII